MSDSSLNDERRKATTRFVDPTQTGPAGSKTRKRKRLRGREMDPNATIEVERVRDTNRGGRDKWRKP